MATGWTADSERSVHTAKQISQRAQEYSPINMASSDVDVQCLTISMCRADWLKSVCVAGGIEFTVLRNARGTLNTQCIYHFACGLHGRGWRL